MAARKSCTHLTWAQAKAKVGGDEHNKPKAKNNKAPTKQNLTLKYISKNTNTREDLSAAAVRRKERADAKVSSAIAAAREKQRAERNALVKTVDLAAKRLESLALQVQTTSLNNNKNNNVVATNDDLEEIAACKEQQLDELLALEAMWSDEIKIDNACGYKELCDLRDNNNMDEQDDSNSLVKNHRNLAFSFSLTMVDFSIDSVEVTAHVLLHVEFPPLYPARAIPVFDILDIMVNDTHATQTADKTLESIAYVEINKAEMEQMAQELVPDPCVVAVISWLQQHIMETATLRSHAKIG